MEKENCFYYITLMSSCRTEIGVHTSGAFGGI